MEEAIISAIPQLGIAGAAMFVLYMQYKDGSNRHAEKDKSLLEEVGKHQETFKEHQKYMREVHGSTMTQLNNASRVIEDNVKAYERVMKMLDKNLNP